MSKIKTVKNNWDLSQQSYQKRINNNYNFKQLMQTKWAIKNWIKKLKWSLKIIAIKVYLIIFKMKYNFNSNNKDIRIK
jgi:hypothetical protein